MAINLPTPVTGSQLLNTPSNTGGSLPTGNQVPLWMTPLPSVAGGGGGGGGSWGPATPTTVVSSKPKAVEKARTAVNNYNTQQTTNATTNQQKADLDATTQSSDRYMRGTGGINPNYVAPQTTGGSTTDPLKQAQTDAILHDGETKVYNQYTGQEEWIKTPTDGTMPSGYSTLDPMSRNDVSDSIQDSEGNTIKKFSDGTFARVDASGNYTLGSEQMFSDAKRVKELSDRLDNARKGIYDDGQKAILDGIQRDYAELIKKQENINANTTGGTTIAMARAGLGNQILGQQKIDKTVNDGIDAIAKLTAAREAALANMKRAFESDDMNALNAAYDIYSKSSDDIQLQIDKTAAAVQSAKDKQEVKNRDNAITMGNKYADAEDIILPGDTPEQVQAKLKTSPTWINEQKTKSGRVDDAVIKGMVNDYLVSKRVPIFKGPNASNEQAAFFAYLGGHPGDIADAVTNKAALDAASNSLKTQQKLVDGTARNIIVLDKNIKVARDLSKQVDRSGSQLANKYLLFTQGKLGATDEDTKNKIAQLDTAIVTVAQEYAKIMSGGGSSASQTSVSSQEEARALINSYLTKGQLEAVFDIIETDSKNQLDGGNLIVNQIQNSIDYIAKQSVGLGTKTGSTSSSTSGSTSSGGGGFAESWD